ARAGGGSRTQRGERAERPGADALRRLGAQRHRERFLGATLMPSTFVLVHGAWSGGWCYARVAALLRARGHTVFTPTLTGQGERAHLFSGAINLSTHIEDVLGVFRFERLSDVVLAGHSYGGMVVTGVADRVPERVRA